MEHNGQQRKLIPYAGKESSGSEWRRQKRRMQIAKRIEELNRLLESTTRTINRLKRELEGL